MKLILMNEDDKVFIPKTNRIERELIPQLDIKPKK